MNFFRIHELFFWFRRSNHCDPHRERTFQNNLNVHVISLEKGDFKLSIGSLNNKFPYTVEGLLNILQLAQHGGEW